MESAEFELLEIDITKEILPVNIHAITIDEINKHCWKLSWSFDFEQYEKAYDLVHVFINFSLATESDEYIEQLMNVAVENTFKVTAGLKLTGKASALDVLFHTTICNMQGFLAAKFEGTAMADAIPPNPYDEIYKEEFLMIAQDEWQI